MQTANQALPIASVATTLTAVATTARTSVRGLEDQAAMEALVLVDRALLASARQED